MRNATSEPDEVAIGLALDGHNVALKGIDRTEALRRMVARGMTAREMAWRLKLNRETVKIWAREHGIEGVTDFIPAHWTLHYVETHGLRGNNGKRHLRTGRGKGQRTGRGES